MSTLLSVASQDLPSPSVIISFTEISLCLNSSERSKGCENVSFSRLKTFNPPFSVPISRLPDLSSLITRIRFPRRLNESSVSGRKFRKEYPSKRLSPWLVPTHIHPLLSWYMHWIWLLGSPSSWVKISKRSLVCACVEIEQIVPNMKRRNALLNIPIFTIYLSAARIRSVLCRDKKNSIPQGKNSM